MKYWLISFLLIGCTASPTRASLTADDCMDIELSLGVSMTDAMVEDLGLQESDIVLEKTKMTLVAQENVTAPMALFFAKEDKKDPILANLNLQELAGIYSDFNPKNLIIRYDYQNRAGKHNILLGSLLINDTECSVRYNGYIIVKREF